MKTYNIITACGVVTRIDALSSFQAADKARSEGWTVIVVSLSL